jgi:hypothetical protein
MRRVEVNEQLSMFAVLDGWVASESSNRKAVEPGSRMFGGGANQCLLSHEIGTFDICSWMSTASLGRNIGCQLQKLGCSKLESPGLRRLFVSTSRE